jgi:curved DNA-binding protein CbpA
MSLSLYEILQVEKTATNVEIRKNYLILAKKYHPDKIKRDASENNTNKNDAFLLIKKAYDTLSDPSKRDRYDRTGVVDNEDSVDFESAYERFRGYKVTEQDIEQYEREYRESLQEQEDLREFFVSHRGDVRNLLAFIIGSKNDDISRFVLFYEQEIQNGNLDRRFKKEFDEAKKQILSVEELDGVGEEDEDGEDIEDEEEEEDVEMDDDDDEEDDDDFIASEDDEEVNDDEEEEDESNTAANEPLFTPGDSIQVRWRSGKKWYDAYVLQVHKKEKTYDVEYVRGKTKETNVPANLVRAKPQKPSEAAVGNAKKFKGAEADLYAAIMNKNKARQDAFDSFAAKYTKKPKKG